jgi:S1-C subfamily serine protease
MRWSDELSAILGSSAIATALVITLPQTAVALSGTQINNIAREVTVLIASENGHGSGVIISRNSDTYYVLTAYHVVFNEDEYALVTHDKQAYAIDYSTVKPLPGVDLAVLEFTSDRDYPTAKFANSDLSSEGQEVFVSGWPAPGTTGQVIRQFTDGRISGFLDTPVEGYQTIYTNVTRRGMSGGAVFDAGGRVIGIHGMGDYEDPRRLAAIEGMSPEAATSIASMIKPGFNYAIPINTYLQLAPQSGIYLNVEVDNTPAPDLGAPYVAGEPDERDTIDNLNSTLDTVGRVVDTVDRIRRFF